MKINHSTRTCGMALLALLIMVAVTGCGSVRDEATGVDGSSVSTVGGTTVVGGDVTMNITTNRDSIGVGDTALVTLTLTCSSASSLNCITNGAGNLVFAAQPTEFQSGDDAPQTATSVTASYSISPAASLGVDSSTSTLAAGTRADSTASPPTSVIPGDTAGEFVFSVVLTGVQTGTVIFTAQTLDTIGSLLLNVF